MTSEFVAPILALSCAKLAQCRRILASLPLSMNFESLKSAIRELCEEEVAFATISIWSHFAHLELTVWKLRLLNHACSYVTITYGVYKRICIKWYERERQQNTWRFFLTRRHLAEGYYSFYNTAP